MVHDDLKIPDVILETADKSSNTKRRVICRSQVDLVECFNHIDCNCSFTNRSHSSADQWYYQTATWSCSTWQVCSVTGWKSNLFRCHTTCWFISFFLRAFHLSDSLIKLSSSVLSWHNRKKWICRVLPARQCCLSLMDSFPLQCSWVPSVQLAGPTGRHPSHSSLPDGLHTDPLDTAVHPSGWLHHYCGTRRAGRCRWGGEVLVVGYRWRKVRGKGSQGSGNPKQ